MTERPTAVIVDDSKPFRMYLSLLLDRMNLEVLPISNAVEAIEVSRVTRPHLLLMDLVMPEMDGLEALRAIRADDDLAEMPVIMMSGYQHKHLQWEALSLGCVDVLEKPIDLRKLHKAVQGCNLYPNGRRRYLRAPFYQDVKLTNAAGSLTVPGISLSERGIFLKTENPMPVKTHVEIDIPLPSGDVLAAGGTVIYSHESNDDLPASSGIAIKFDRMLKKDMEILSALVESLLIGDIIAQQSEPFIKPA